MNAPGVLLDTGPLVALLSERDTAHARAKRMFAACLPPFRCCEAVVAEACFLMRKVHSDGPAEVLALAGKGVYDMSRRSANSGRASKDSCASTPTAPSRWRTPA